ncbi:MAG TPA: sulfotransferase [Rhizomicrobium sp.]|nr:sulfotransferase [Rhizomicrobium sp.]
MSKSTQPFFVVSSGRSGTAMLQKAFAACGEVEMHHEYMVHHIQKLGVERYLGLADRAKALKTLEETHVAAIRYSDAAFWGDSSNKLSWLIPELAALLPDAKFVHLVRDGRKVAGSYFHKLGNECYDDRSTAILQAHVDDPSRVVAPPPEKKYWWPVPRSGDPRAPEFRAFDQFQRIAWHWAEINATIMDAMQGLSAERRLLVRLEDLVAAPAEVKRLFAFLGIPHREEYHSAFARPHNVNRPEDRLLSEGQRMAFDRIACATMDRLGYAGRPEYVVNY